MAAGRPPTPTGAAAPSALPPPGEAAAFPSGTAPLLGPAVADEAAVTPTDGPAPEVEDGAPIEGAADGALDEAGCALAVADGVAVGAASAGTST